jgi:hypothetical protein
VGYGEGAQRVGWVRLVGRERRWAQAAGRGGVDGSAGAVLAEGGGVGEADGTRGRCGWAALGVAARGAGGGGGVSGGVVAFGAVVLGVEGGAEVEGGGVEMAAYVDLVGAGAGVVGGEDVAGGVADVGQGYAGG